MTTRSETLIRSSHLGGGIWPVYLAGAAVFLLVTGSYVLWQLTTDGKASFNTTNDGVHWGLPIVVYDYFLMVSTGLGVVAGLYHVLGIEAFRPVARRALWLALAAMMGGVCVLFLELGNPLLATWAIPLSLQTDSPLFWKVMLVGVYAIALGVTLMVSIGKPVTRTPVPVSLITALAVAITLVAGAVYGMMAMRPMWFGGEIPVMFLNESVVGGLSFVVFFSYLAQGFSRDSMSGELKALLDGPLARLFALTIALHLLFLGSRAITGLWSNAEGLQVWDYLVSQPLFHVGIWGCTLVPLLLMAWSGTRTFGTAQLAASLLIMIGLFIGRYEFVIGGQLVPLFKGAWVHGLIEYAPSLTEWALLGVGIGVANVVYAVAGWKLGGSAER